VQGAQISAPQGKYAAAVDVLEALGSSGAKAGQLLSALISWFLRFDYLFREVQHRQLLQVRVAGSSEARSHSTTLPSPAAPP
jgi:hypothetical protein